MALIAKHMKTLLLAVAVLVGGGVCAQTDADMKMAEALNGGDMYLLRERYSELKGSLSMDVLDLLAQSLVASAFNDPDTAVRAMAELLQNHHEELGGDNVYGISSLWAMNLLNMGLYGQAGSAAANTVAAFEGQVPPESLHGLAFIAKVDNVLSDYPVPRMERPDRDVTVPMRRANVDNGELIYIPVKVNGVERDFVFSTECSFGAFASESYAEEAGLEIVADSVPMEGVATGYVKLATAGALEVGEMVYRNPVFIVMPHNPDIDAAYRSDGCLGYGFMSAAHEVVIDTEAGQFVFPHEISGGDPNLCLSPNTPSARIEYGGMPFDIAFNTGSARSDLGIGFARAFPDAVAGLEEHEATRDGYGITVTVGAVTIPEFRFRVGDTEAVLPDVEAVTRSTVGSLAGKGMLGADFVLSFRRLTINYDNMFIRGE